MQDIHSLQLQETPLPLKKSKSKKAFKENVEQLMSDVGKSPHVQSQKQALAIAYSIKDKKKKKK